MWFFCLYFSVKKQQNLYKIITLQKKHKPSDFMRPEDVTRRRLERSQMLHLNRQNLQFTLHSYHIYNIDTWQSKLLFKILISKLSQKRETLSIPKTNHPSACKLNAFLGQTHMASTFENWFSRALFQRLFTLLHGIPRYFTVISIRHWLVL